MYRRTYYRSRIGKYSNETTAINIEATQNVEANFTFPQNEEPDPATGTLVKGSLIVPATTLQGNRKVKNITLKLTATGNESPIVGALVYVPEGTVPSDLSTSLHSQSLYEPNQNVILSFLLPPSCDRDPTGGVTTYFTPPATTVSTKLARNLSAGDMIVLVFSAPNGINAGDGTLNVDTGRTADPMHIFGTANFAIKY